jgi:signal transduction histidine kinase
MPWDLLFRTDPKRSPEAGAPTDAGRALRPIRFGLASRVMWLVILFVMLAEVAVYVPSIASFHNAWLHDRLSSAYTAALVFEAAPASAVPDELAGAILGSVGAKTIVLKTKDTRRLLAVSDMPSWIAETVDLRDPSFWGSVVSTFHTLSARRDRVLNIVGDAPMGADHIEITLDEAPLRRAMWRYSINVLLVSLAISAIVALLAMAAIHVMVLRPVRRLTTNITAFGRNPEDASLVIEPSGMSHEIGVAEDALAVMQRDLLRELNRKTRLAALGLAVAKINHDLRNMLASAQLLSDRLSELSDPLGRRLAPKLVATLDRAIAFCQSTLVYGRAVERPPKPGRLALHPLVEDVIETVAPMATGITLTNEVARDCEIYADTEQLFRVLMTLVRNGVDALMGAGAQAGAPPEVAIRARRDGEIWLIEVSDNGPGVPERARAALFQPFLSAARPGGTGLGLSIAADIVRAHGGEISLVRAESATAAGATFRFSLPAKRRRSAQQKPAAPGNPREKGTPNAKA